MNIKTVIVANFLFLIANLTWHLVGDQKIFWISMALLLVAFNVFLWKTYDGSSKYIGCFIEYFMLLSWGNLVKQIFYSDVIKQINDYALLSLLTLILIIRLWVIRRQHGKSLNRHY